VRESDPVFDPGDYEIDNHIVQLLEKILKELRELNKNYNTHFIFSSGTPINYFKLSRAYDTDINEASKK